MFTAAIYARTSTQWTDPTWQVERARGFAVANGWRIDDHYVFVDDGIRGGEFGEHRPGLSRLLATLKPRAPFQALITLNHDRLGRDQVETPSAIKEIVYAGVRLFYSIDGREVILDTASDELRLNLEAFSATMTSRHSQEYTRAGLEIVFKRGHVTGGRCFGYENVRVGDGKRSHVERRIVETEAVVIRSLFQLYADGLFPAAIARRLNEEGATSPTSQRSRPKGWATCTVQEALRREIYVGQLVWNKTVTLLVRGKYRQVPVPAPQWLRIAAPQLRIVPADLQGAVYARLQRESQRYEPFRGLDRKLRGRPKDEPRRWKFRGDKKAVALP